MMKQSKFWIASMLSASLLFTGSVISGAELAQAAKASSNVNAGPPIVVLKSNGMITQKQGLYINGQTWVPVTFMRDILNLPLEYDAESKVYSLGQGHRTVHLSVSPDRIGIDVNGYYLHHMEGKMVNGHLFVPFALVRDYLGYQGDWYAPTKRLNVMKSKENILQIETLTTEQPSKEAIIRLQYPQISDSGNPAAEQAINEALKRTIQEFEASIEKQLQDRDDASEPPYEYESHYIITHNTDGILSLILQKYEYTGGAHGMTVQKGYTFSLQDGHTLTLDDLFGTNREYKKLLNGELAAKLEALPDYMGGFAGVGQDTEFYVQRDKLKIFFQLYEYTPYASGMPEFSIPFSTLLPTETSPLR
ncbi:DUF3298 and DUF4163 domain-containing protein [Paenibacillus ihumii]|uniref:DUF3298 and DUF4163 domain-containing protein n=1 Tax=Paenibacillus ihumii TaxID=687436 RepID=UPI0006D83BEF|nr:DUF3298 and DUF4163 domain-containing protein [Paenibacillus ihumii]